MPAYRVSGSPDVANAASASQILVVDHPTFANHNGGGIAFGPDGGAADPKDWPTLSPPDMIQSFGQDAAGELYVLTTSAVLEIVPQ